MYRIKEGMKETFTINGIDYHIEIAYRHGMQCEIHQTYTDAWGDKHNETYVSPIDIDGREECVTIVDDYVLFATDFDDGREYQRMGIDYSPSCPWNAPGMSIHDFI